MELGSFASHDESKESEVRMSEIDTDTRWNQKNLGSDAYRGRKTTQAAVEEARSGRIMMSEEEHGGEARKVKETNPTLRW